MGPRPALDPLPEPAQFDPSATPGLAILAAEDLDQVDRVLDALGLTLPALHVEVQGGSEAASALSQTLALGAGTLQDLAVEAAGDTLVNEISAAADVDRALADSADLSAPIPEPPTIPAEPPPPEPGEVPVVQQVPPPSFTGAPTLEVA